MTIVDSAFETVPSEFAAVHAECPVVYEVAVDKGVEGRVECRDEPE